PILYTTNYDNNLEVAYRLARRGYVKIVNARDLAHAEDGCTQIVKYHGDFEEDSSLVLAETDYFDRLNFDSPLDVKFRADALGRTILFVGYSMSDMNIRLLLHKLWRTWAGSGRIKDRPPSFVFAARPDRVRDAVLDQWGITVLSSAERNPEKALVRFLEQLLQDVKDDA
ncbi:MAG TPA: SIR2 family protein, partial [Sphingomonas sp.]|nr:SIR2 family protein [Sphingomonas sp.]